MEKKRQKTNYNTKPYIRETEKDYKLYRLIHYLLRSKMIIFVIFLQTAADIKVTYLLQESKRRKPMNRSATSRTVDDEHTIQNSWR